MLDIVREYTENSQCVRHVYEKNINNKIYRFLYFRIYEATYVWGDVMINGLIECSQLDKVYNDNIATVLYSNIENVPACAPFLFMMIENNDIVQLV